MYKIYSQIIMRKTGFIFIYSLLVIIMVLYPCEMISAQGAIHGIVERADGSTPPDQSLLFFGFTNGTDDEIHLSGSVGVGYDLGHWYDDFQNFQFAPPGAAFTYYFYDTIAWESADLDSLISSDGFQQHDITLSPRFWPDPPMDVELARSVEGDIHLRWLIDSLITVHIYRRVLPSEGSFFRIDDPAGTLIGSGISSGQFLDAGTAYETGYTYLLLAVDQSGVFSPPVVMETASAFCCGLYTGGYPGNTNGDEEGLRDLADITALIDRVYLTKNLLWCDPAGNTSGDVEQKLDLADITKLIDLVYVSKVELMPCF